MVMARTTWKKHLANPETFTAVSKARISLKTIASSEETSKDKSEVVEFKELVGAKGESNKEALRKTPFHAQDHNLLEWQQSLHNFSTNSYSRAILKNALRDTDEYTHEWIPCQLIADTVRRSSVLKCGVWSQLQVSLRTPTSDLVFKPAVASVIATINDRADTVYGLRKAEAPEDSHVMVMEKGVWGRRDLKVGDKCIILQGHEGNLKLDESLIETYKSRRGYQNHGSSPFHNQLLYAFDRNECSSDKPSHILEMTRNFIAELKTIADAWLWDPLAASNEGMTGILLPFLTWKYVEGTRTTAKVDSGNFAVWAKVYSEARANVLTMFNIVHGTLHHVIQGL